MIDFNKTGYQLANVTEAVARATMIYSGKGDKTAADKVAVETMRALLDSCDLNIRIHLGEGEKDNAPMLYSGERLGLQKDRGEDDLLDLVVDPLECTTNFSRGLPDSLVVMLAAPGGFIRPVPGTYMEQMLVPEQVAHRLDDDLDLDTPIDQMLQIVAESLGRSVSDITVVVQDRQRHDTLITEIRKAGAGISLIESGSISAAAEVILRNNGRIHMVRGIFGAPEGLIIAAMANLSGAGFLGRVHPHNDHALELTRKYGLEGVTLKAEELVGAQDVLLISGIHTATWLPGVERRFRNGESIMKVKTLMWNHRSVRIITHENGEMLNDAPFVVRNP